MTTHGQRNHGRGTSVPILPSGPPDRTDILLSVRSLIRCPLAARPLGPGRQLPSHGHRDPTRNFFSGRSWIRPPFIKVRRGPTGNTCSPMTHYCSHMPTLTCIGNKAAPTTARGLGNLCHTTWIPRGRGTRVTEQHSGGGGGCSNESRNVDSTIRPLDISDSLTVSDGSSVHRAKPPTLVGSAPSTSEKEARFWPSSPRDQEGERPESLSSVEEERDDSFTSVIDLIRRYHNLEKPAGVTPSRALTTLGLRAEASPALHLPPSRLVEALVDKVNSTFDRFVEEQTPYSYTYMYMCVYIHTYICIYIFQEYEEPVYSYSTYPDRRFSSSTSQHFKNVPSIRQ